MQIDNENIYVLSFNSRLIYEKNGYCLGAV